MLSMRAVTGKPIKHMGTGEKVDALEEFHPRRVASRILGRVTSSPWWRRQRGIRPGEAQRMAKKMRKGKFDLDDMRDQLAQMEKIGGFAACSACCPASAR